MTYIKHLSGNVGIGTTRTSTAALTVMNGNVGVGTWIPSAPLTVGNNAFTVNTNGAIATSGGYVQSGTGVNTFSGNVGIGSLSPGQALDVNGTVRMTGFTLSGNGAANGNILVTNSVGVGTWMPVSGLVTSSQWTTINTNDVFLPNSGNVGLGTTKTSAAALSVMNGNVGIGTWVPGNNLSVVGGIGIGSATYAGTAAPLNGIIVSGNVGIGSLAPGQSLDVNGTVRMTGLTMSGPGPASGYVLTATDSSGDTTWSTAGGVSGWTITNTNDVYQTRNGNVGIGTTFTTTAALSVMNGNVGVGTWIPTGLLDINRKLNVLASGNVGIGSITPGQALDVNGTVRMTGFTLSGNGAANGNILVTNSVGVGTWMSINGLVNSSQWVTTNTNDVYLPSSGNVGLGTTITNSAAFTVMNGNVGIGTWVPATKFDIVAPSNTTTDGLIIRPTNLTQSLQIGWGGFNSTGVFTMHSASNLILQTTAGNVNLMPSSGNVGIGSLAPGQTLDVVGTVRMTGLTVSGNGPASGYVLTATDSSGDTTWSTAGGVSGWTITNTNDVYETGSGNVGIGTTITSNAALAVMNGNVGIGTWIPSSSLSINGSIAVRTVSVSAASYTALATDQIIFANTTGNSITITLPPAASVPGREYVIKKTDGSANFLKIQGNGAENIDGQNSISTTLQYQSYTLICDGTQWFIV